MARRSREKMQLPDKRKLGGIVADYAPKVALITIVVGLLFGETLTQSIADAIRSVIVMHMTARLLAGRTYD